MAFLDKLTDAAANLGDKASDAIETTKIKAKINGEKKDIDADLVKLGRIYYEKAKDGEELTEEAMALVEKVDQHYAAIADLEKELN
jgi:hypothetical protein